MFPINVYQYQHMQVLRIPFDKIEEMQHLVLVMSMLSLKRKVPSVERLLLGPQKDCSRCLTVLMNLSQVYDVSLCQRIPLLRLSQGHVR